MIKSTEKFNFSEPMLKTTKLGLIRLSLYNSVFNVSRRNIEFLFEYGILAVIRGAFDLFEIAELIKKN